MSSITADPAIAMTHRSGNLCTTTSQDLWLLQRTSNFAPETGHRSSGAGRAGGAARTQTAIVAGVARRMSSW
jgi:hypothetical protein